MLLPAFLSAFTSLSGFSPRLMKVPPFAALFLLIFAMGAAPLAAAPVTPKEAWRFAFNSGNRSPEGIQAAKDKKLLEQTPAPGGGYVEKYLRIEQFEGSKITSRAQQTVFTYGEATYAPSLSGSMVLLNVKLSYVILDYQGRLPASGTSYEISLNATDPTKNAFKERPSAKNFYEALPGWARAQLHLISGFLEANPGMPVIAYQTTDGENLSTAVGWVLDFAPTPAPKVIKNAAGEVVMNVIKKLTSIGVREAVKTGDLRWRLDNSVTAEKALQNRAVYEGKGANMWKF